MQFLKLVLLPPMPLLIIVLAGLFAPARMRWLRAAGVAALLLFGALGTPLVSGFLLSRLERYPPARLNNAAGAQAIVILSAEQRSQPEYGALGPGALSLERLRYGAYLAHATGLPVLISGGDPGADGGALAQSLGRSLASDFGVTPSALEGRSLDTIGNARESAAILKAGGVSRVLLVTHAWHMPRAKLAFERAGLEVTPAPTAYVGDPLHRVHSLSDLARGLIPQASGLQTSFYFFHEAIGLAALKLSPAAAPAKTD